jgi:hypothetical protein
VARRIGKGSGIGRPRRDPRTARAAAGAHTKERAEFQTSDLLVRAFLSCPSSTQVNTAGKPARSRSSTHRAS